jgi:hypothetical protein
LGHGDLSARALPAQVLHLRKKQVTQMSLGRDFILALGRDIDPTQKRQKKKDRKSKRLDTMNENKPQESFKGVSSSNETLDEKPKDQKTLPLNRFIGSGRSR